MVREISGARADVKGSTISEDAEFFALPKDKAGWLYELSMF